MLRWILLSAFALLAAVMPLANAGAQTCPDNRRVVGGVDTDIADHPGRSRWRRTDRTLNAAAR